MGLACHNSTIYNGAVGSVVRTVDSVWLTKLQLFPVSHGRPNPGKLGPRSLLTLTPLPIFGTLNHTWLMLQDVRLLLHEAYCPVPVTTMERTPTCGLQLCSPPQRMNDRQLSCVGY